MLAIRAYSLLLLLLLSGTGWAQVQWASSVRHAYHADQSEGYGPEEALGVPNVKQLGSVQKGAFRLANEKSFASLIVEFDNSEIAEQIVILQNNHPGTIVNVEVYDENNLDYKIYVTHSEKTAALNEALIITLHQFPISIKRIEIDINSNFNPGFTQIDAVGIANMEDQALNNKILEVAPYNIKTVKAISGTREKLNTQINTSYDEVNPVITQDGKTLYFTRVGHPGNAGGNRDYGDIYKAELFAKNWGMPTNLGTPLNNKQPNGVSSISPDQNSMLMLNPYEENDPSADLSISKRYGSTWEYPTEMYIDSLENYSDYVDYFISSTGNTLISAIENESSFGDQDLFVSKRIGENRWSRPVNLGSQVNSEQAEFSPFLASDNKTLYFSSTGHNGMGDSDIYFTKRLDDSWTSWSKPENIGEKINTSGFDGYYSITADGHYAYFVSDTDGTDGSRDIFRIATDAKFQPEPVLFIHGFVFNQLTNEPLAARIVFETLPNGKEMGVARSNPETGEYKIILPRGHNYGYYAEAESFIALNEHINLEDNKRYQELVKNLYLIPITNGQSLTMNNIFFESAKADLLPESFPELNRLAAILNTNKDISLEIAGHTDNIGTNEINDQLSLNRAESVKQYLISHNIAADRITSRGYGSHRPVSSNESAAGRQQNRRVEVKILKNEG